VNADMVRKLLKDEGTTLKGVACAVYQILSDYVINQRRHFRSLPPAFPCETGYTFIHITIDVLVFSFT
jgi:hypothetical protein